MNTKLDQLNERMNKAFRDFYFSDDELPDFIEAQLESGCSGPIDTDPELTAFYNDLFEKEMKGYAAKLPSVNICGAEYNPTLGELLWTLYPDDLVNKFKHVDKEPTPNISAVHSVGKSNIVYNLFPVWMVN